MEAVLRQVDFKYLKAKRLKAKYLEKVLRKSTQKKYSEKDDWACWVPNHHAGNMLDDY